MLRLWEARITVIAAQAAGWVARPYLMILGPRAGPDHRTPWLDQHPEAPALPFALLVACHHRDNTNAAASSQAGSYHGECGRRSGLTTRGECATEAALRASEGASRPVARRRDRDGGRARGRRSSRSGAFIPSYVPTVRPSAKAST